MTNEVLLSVKKLRKWFPVKSAALFGEKMHVKAVNDTTKLTAVPPPNFHLFYHITPFSSIYILIFTAKQVYF